MANKISLSDKIFIAGAKGMVGSAIKRKLVKSGYGDETKGGKILTPSRSELDLLDYSNLKKWFKLNKPEVVIIAAAKVGGIFANANNPMDFIFQNLKIQTNIIEESFLNNVKRLLFLGSSCIYPKFSRQPIKEEYLLTGSLEKTNEMYAIAKIAGIKLCESLRMQENFDAISLMPTNLYGPGDNYCLNNSHVLAAFIRRFYEAKLNNADTVTCWGSGSPLREFLHVDDLSDAVKFVLESWDPKENSFLDEANNDIFYLNVGTGKDITIKELAEKISRKINFEGKIIWDKSKPDGTPKKQLDISKLRELGWQSQINLNHGLDLTIKSFKEELKNKKCRL